MSTKTAELNLLYLGSDKPGTETLKQELLDYFKGPVLLYQARTMTEFKELLGRRLYDVIIVAENADGIDPAFQILEITAELCPGLPVICLTDTCAGDTLELIRKGAADCVPRDGASPLSFAVIREIERQRRPGALGPAAQEERRRGDFHRMLLTLAKTCVNATTDRLLDSFSNAMAMIARYCGADTIVCYLFDLETNKARRHYEWTRTPELQSPELVKSVPLTDLGDMLDCLRLDKPYIRNSLEGTSEKSWYQTPPGSTAAGSLCACPAFFGSRLAGMLALLTVGRPKDWSDDELTAFKISCELIVSMMQRIDGEIKHDEKTRTNALILDALNEGVALLDRESTALYVNKRLAEKFGKAPEQLVGTQLTAHIQPEKYVGQIAMSLDIIRKVFDSGTPAAHVDQWGSNWFHNQFSPVLENNRVVSVALVSSDITDRVRLEQNAVLEKETEILRAKERELLEILDSAADSSCVIDYKAGTYDYSEKWLRHIGGENIPKEDLPNYFENLVHPADRYRVVRERAEALRLRKPRIKFEYRLRMPGGGYIWALVRGKLTYDQDGAPVKCYSTLTDITENKHVEETLRLSEEKYRLLFDSMGEGFSITSVVYDENRQPADYRYLEVNSAYEQHTGLRPADILGKTLLEVLPDIEAAWLEMYARVVTTGTPERRQDYNVSTNRFYDVTAFAPKPGHMAVILKDISEQKTAEEALRNSENMALSLVRELEKTKRDLTEEVHALRRLHWISGAHQNKSDLIHFYNDILDTAIEVTHACKGHIQLFVERENCFKIIAQLGFSPPYLTHFAVVPLGQKPSSAALAKKERVFIDNTEDSLMLDMSEVSLYRAEGIVSFQSTPLISSSGAVYGVLNTHFDTAHQYGDRERGILDILAGMAADFIERKRSEVALEVSERNAKALVEALQSADRSKNEFLNQLSHELRNPLATINAAIALIQISGDLRQIRETNGVLKSEADQLGRLVDDLLDVTRLTTNKIKLKPVRMNLTETVRTSVNNFRVRFREKDVRFSMEAGSQPIYLHADAARIMQIVENLLTNALKYTDEGGAVVLSLSEDAGQAVLRVSDSGIGIRPEELPLLFNAFYQAEKPPERTDSGLGLGLTIVKSIAELHGGRVAAFSKGLGMGSMFTVALPMNSKPPIDTPSDITPDT